MKQRSDLTLPSPAAFKPADTEASHEHAATPGNTFGSLAVARVPAGALVVAEDDQDALMGAQLTAHFFRCVSNRKDDVILGAMGIRVRDRLNDSARGTDSANRGRASKGGGVKGWLGEFAPLVSESILNRCMEIAEGVQEEFRLGKKVDLEALLSIEAGESLTGALAKTRAKIMEMIEGKSQRQLLLTFGRAEGKRKGGARTKGEEGDAPKKPLGWTDEKWEHYLGLDPEMREAVDTILPVIADLNQEADPELTVIPKLPKAYRDELARAHRALGKILASCKAK